MATPRKTQFSALMIAYWFPPASNQTWRSYHIYNELKTHFNLTKVITSGNWKSPENTAPQNRSSDTSFAPTFDYRTIYKFRKKNSAHLSEEKKSKVGFLLYNLLNSFPFNILLGEGGLVYIITAYYQAVKYVRSYQVSFLFSSYRPFSDHIVGLLLKARFPSIFWVADFRDLHVDPALKETFFPRFQLWCNRKILAKANVVTTVSKGLAEHLKLIHPNVVVLRNGIGKYSELSNVIEQPLNLFTIAYTGSMFRNLRRPDLLLEALSELFLEKSMDRDKVEILYAGKDEATWKPLLEKYGLWNTFRPLGNISHEAALQLQKNAHINLLLTYATAELKGNATGKLYEYLAARQPILLLINGSLDEELEEIFEETKAGLVAYYGQDEKSSVKIFLLKQYQIWQQSGKTGPAIEIAELEKFRWKYMMQEFLENHFFSQFNEQPKI